MKYLNYLKQVCIASMLLCALAGCASHNPPFKPSVGITDFQQWCRLALNGDTDSPEKALFRSAYGGDIKATEAFFQMALDYQMDEVLRPADEMWLSWVLVTLLYRQGDIRFAETLREQSPQPQAAVKTFLPSYSTEQFPQTKAILESAPKIDFPLEQAYRKYDG